MNQVLSYSIVILYCLNNIVRNKSNFGIDFQIRGLFYITLFYLLYGLYISKTFRKIFYSNLNIFIWFFLIISIINGFLNQNDIYFIKEDFYNVLIVYSGILAPILIYGNKIKIDSKIIILISSFYFLMILYFLLNGTITLGTKNSIYSVTKMLAIFFPFLIFQCTRNRILNISNHKLYFLILVILFYETFISFTRMNIIGVLLSSIFIFQLTKTKNQFSNNLHFIKNLCLILLILLISGPFLIFLQTGFVDRLYSDSYRLFEAAYLYQNYISDKILIGNGLGATFIAPTFNVVETAAHIGFFTILLKFGLLGLIIFSIIIAKPFFMFIFHSDLKKLNNNWIVLIFSSLIFWFISFSVGKGTFPEQLFGLGLAIGSYIQFKSSKPYLGKNI